LSEPLWQLTDFEQFVVHPLRLVRDWARDRLAHLALGDTVPLLIRLLADQDQTIVGLTAARLGELADTRAAPVLLETLGQWHGRPAGEIMTALGKLNYSPALPQLLERLQGTVGLSEAVGIISASAQLGGDEVHAQLIAEWRQAPEDDVALAALANCLLGQTWGIEPVVEKLARVTTHAGPWLRAIEDAAEVHRVCDDLASQEHVDFDQLCERLRVFYRLPVQAVFTAAVRRAARQFGRGHRLAERLALYPQAARDALTARGWSDERLRASSSDFARQAAKRLALLDACAQQRRPFMRLADEDVYVLERVLVVITALAGGLRDYQTELDAAPDRAEALWELCLSDDPFVPETISRQIAAIGAAAIPRLFAAVEPSARAWRTERASYILSEIAQQDPQVLAAYAPNIVAWFPRLEMPDGVWTAGREILKAVGEPVLDAIAAGLPPSASTQATNLLDVLGNIPYARSVELILNHLSAFLVLDDGGTLNALRNLGSARAIEPLRAERREGEELLDETLLLLCELNAVTVPELPDLRGAYERSRQRAAERQTLLAPARTWDDVLKREAELARGMQLRLRCQRCLRVYTYDVGTVYYDIDAPGVDAGARESVFLKRKIVCKNCRAVDQYEFTLSAEEQLMSEIITMRMASSELVRAQHGTPRMRLTRFHLKDGRRMNPRRALDAVRAEVETSPRDVEPRIVLGELYRFLERFDDARAQFERACALDAQNSEAAFLLAVTLEELDRLSESRALFERVLDLVERSPDLRWRIETSQLARQGLAHVERRMQDPAYWTQDERRRLRMERPDSDLPLWATTGGLEPAAAARTAPLRAAPKVGRNEPCPCGSGKKYKHCHGLPSASP
jgi:tetratricopeptide (TPR) repeat protein